MSNIELGDSGINEVVGKMSSLLSGPEKKETEVETELPPEPKVGLKTQRNTVENKSTQQEGTPEEASAEGEESEGDESPPLEAPNSWDAEAKAKWEKLPADLKALVAAREAEREKALGTKLQETAELRKKTEAENAQTLQTRNAYEQRLLTLARQLEGNIPAEFRELKGPQDLANLAEKDPAAAQRFLIWREMANSVLGEINQLEQQKIQHAQAQQQELLQKETKALVEKWPEVMDPVKGPALRGEITTLLSSFGFTGDEIAGVSDHRILLFAKQYMEGQKALKANDAAKSKVTAKPLPKVMKANQGEGTGPSSLNKAQLSRAARSGDMAQTQAALEKLLAS